MQPYLCSTHLNVKEKELLLSLRLRMTKTRANYKSMYPDISCNLCGTGATQSDAHLLDCVKIMENCETLSNNHMVEYEDIFGEEEQQIHAARLFANIFEAKERIEKLMDI